MTPRHDECDVAVVGSGFSGALMARILSVLGYQVTLVERGSHPRFALGESTTPLANLSLERLGRRYGLADCYRLATYGRWIEHYPDVRRGLKRGFTFYRHHPGERFNVGGGERPAHERLLVAASPNDSVADTQWLRADVDHHFVREAIAVGVDYRERADLTGVEPVGDGLRLTGMRDGSLLAIKARFVIDATGPNGFLARHLAIPSALDSTLTNSALVFSHFTNVGPLRDTVSGLPDGPYPDEWAAVHHLIDEGWMYSLRFDHGVTSAGFLLTPRGRAALGRERTASELWSALLERYPTIGSVFGNAVPEFPVTLVPRVQHRSAGSVGDRWALLPHSYAFVDPLFSTGIAWSLRAIERLALAFESAQQLPRRSQRASYAGAPCTETPNAEFLARYAELLSREADQIDCMIAGAYEAMAHFDLFAAHAMLYFATVSYAEVQQRVAEDDQAGWRGFLGVGDPVLEPLPGESLRRLSAITRSRGEPGSTAERDGYVAWVTRAIASRNVAGLADASRNNLYPVDLDLLIDRHALLGMTRDQLVVALPALRGMSPEPVFSSYRAGDRSTSQSDQRDTTPPVPAPR